MVVIIVIKSVEEEYRIKGKNSGGTKGNKKRDKVIVIKVKRNEKSYKKNISMKIKENNTRK